MRWQADRGHSTLALCAAVKLVLVAVLGSSGADQNISQNVNYHPAQHYQDLAPLRSTTQRQH
jgi:hypothetical protein